MRKQKIEMKEIDNFYFFEIDGGVALGRVKVVKTKKEIEMHVPEVDTKYKFGAIFKVNGNADGLISKDGQVFEYAGLFVIEGEEYTLSEILEMEVEELK